MKQWLIGFIGMGVLTIGSFVIGFGLGGHLEYQRFLDRSARFDSSAIKYVDSAVWTPEEKQAGDAIDQEFRRQRDEGRWASIGEGLVTTAGVYGAQKEPFLILSVGRCGGDRPLELFVSVHAVLGVAKEEEASGKSHDEALRYAASIALRYLWEKANPSEVS